MARYGDKTTRLGSLFGDKNSKNTIKVSKLVSSSSIDTLASEIESADYIREEIKDKHRVVPMDLLKNTIKLVLKEYLKPTHMTDLKKKKFSGLYHHRI